MDEELIIPIVCKECKSTIGIGKDDSKSDDIKIIKFHCDCGNIVEMEFMGYPFLGESETHVFEFLTEEEYQCLRKK